MEEVMTDAVGDFPGFAQAKRYFHDGADQHTDCQYSITNMLGPK